jgi:Zn-dependent protease with chaperone function
MNGLYFDGSSAKGRPVRLRVEGGRLWAEPLATGHEGAARVAAAAQADSTTSQPASWPLEHVRWPERTRHTRRVIDLVQGGSIEVADAAAFDAWRAQQGGRESPVVRAQQNWRTVAMALVLLLATIGAGWRWGVPFAADTVVALLPAAADTAVGDAALASLDGPLLKASQLPLSRQQALTAAFEQALGQAVPSAEASGALPRVPWRLLFRRGGPALGPNALALPGGTIVLTDEMVELLTGHDDTVLGVLAHEYGHLVHRHGMRALAHGTLLSAAASLALGDFSGLVVGVPVLLSQASYSRSAEREADTVSAQVLKASGRSPAAMVVLFERLREPPARPGRGASSASSPSSSPSSPAPAASEPQPSGWRITIPMALASHPHDDERVRFFREAADRR